MENVTTCPTNTATILACQKIAKSFKENIYELSMVRNEWDPEYATSLSIWIDDTIEKHYANTLDDLKDTRYRKWHEIMVAGLQHLKVLRASIKVDFKDDKDFSKDFFNLVGYNDFFSDAKNGDHISLYKFLKTFAENLNEVTRHKIVAKGSMDSLFDKILICSNQITEFEDCFMALEGDANLNTYGKKEVIEIYSAIKDICRVAIAYYQSDPLKRDQFNYYKILVNL